MSAKGGGGGGGEGGGGGPAGGAGKPVTLEQLKEEIEREKAKHHENYQMWLKVNKKKDQEGITEFIKYYKESRAKLAWINKDNTEVSKNNCITEKVEFGKQQAMKAAVGLTTYTGVVNSSRDTDDDLPDLGQFMDISPLKPPLAPNLSQLSIQGIKLNDAQLVDRIGSAVSTGKTDKEIDIRTMDVIGEGDTNAQQGIHAYVNSSHDTDDDLPDLGQFMDISPLKPPLAPNLSQLSIQGIKLNDAQLVDRIGSAVSTGKTDKEIDIRTMDVIGEGDTNAQQGIHAYVNSSHDTDDDLPDLGQFMDISPLKPPLAPNLSQLSIQGIKLNDAQLVDRIGSAVSTGKTDKEIDIRTMDVIGEGDTNAQQGIHAYVNSSHDTDDDLPDLGQFMDISPLKPPLAPNLSQLSIQGIKLNDAQLVDRIGSAVSTGKTDKEIDIRTMDVIGEGDTNAQQGIHAYVNSSHDTDDDLPDLGQFMDISPLKPPLAPNLSQLSIQGIKLNDAQLVDRIGSAVSTGKTDKEIDIRTMDVIGEGDTNAQQGIHAYVNSSHDTDDDLPDLGQFMDISPLKPPLAPNLSQLSIQGIKLNDAQLVDRIGSAVSTGKTDKEIDIRTMDVIGEGDTNAQQGIHAYVNSSHDTDDDLPDLGQFMDISPLKPPLAPNLSQLSIQGIKLNDAQLVDRIGSAVSTGKTDKEIDIRTMDVIGEGDTNAQQGIHAYVNSSHDTDDDLPDLGQFMDISPLKPPLAPNLSQLSIQGIKLNDAQLVDRIGSAVSTGKTDKEIDIRTMDVIGEGDTNAQQGIHAYVNSSHDTDDDLPDLGQFMDISPLKPPLAPNLSQLSIQGIKLNDAQLVDRIGSAVSTGKTDKEIDIRTMDVIGEGDTNAQQGIHAYVNSSHDTDDDLPDLGQFMDISPLKPPLAPNLSQLSIQGIKLNDAQLVDRIGSAVSTGKTDKEIDIRTMDVIGEGDTNAQQGIHAYVNSSHDTDDDLPDLGQFMDISPLKPPLAPNLSQLSIQGIKLNDAQLVDRIGSAVSTGKTDKEIDIRTMDVIDEGDTNAQQMGEPSVQLAVRQRADSVPRADSDPRETPLSPPTQYKDAVSFEVPQQTELSTVAHDNTTLSSNISQSFDRTSDTHKVTDEQLKINKTQKKALEPSATCQHHVGEVSHGNAEGMSQGNSGITIQINVDGMSHSIIRVMCQECSGYQEFNEPPLKKKKESSPPFVYYLNKGQNKEVFLNLALNTESAEKQGGAGDATAKKAPVQAEPEATGLANTSNSKVAEQHSQHSDSALMSLQDLDLFDFHMSLDDSMLDYDYTSILDLPCTPKTDKP